MALVFNTTQALRNVLIAPHLQPLTSQRLQDNSRQSPQLLPPLVPSSVDSFSWRTKAVFRSQLALALSVSMDTNSLTHQPPAVSDACNNSEIMPYGCLRADASGLCVECRYGFDFDATSSRCHKGRGNFMRLGTQALVSRNSLNGDPTINHAPPLTAWTIQFYLMVQPSSKNFGTFMHRFLVASGGTDSLELQLDYQYNMGLPINDLKISFIHWGGSIQSGPKTISKGEWIFASFYMVTGPTSYDLLIFKHGTTTIGATGSIALSQTILKLNSADLTIYLKQLIIWNQSFSADPNINSHACR